MIEVVWEQDWLRSSVQDTWSRGRLHTEEGAMAVRPGVMKAPDRMVTGKTEGKRWVRKKLGKDHQSFLKLFLV